MPEKNGVSSTSLDVVDEVPAVYFLEKFGSPEAIWHLACTRFPVVITMDAHGNSLHDEVANSSGAQMEKLLAGL